MVANNKLSLASAILINLNVMIGSGIFVNTVLLSKNAGGLGAATYVVVGILLLPLLLSMYHLATIHKGGNFYDYGSSISPVVGFMTMMSYFLAKLSSCTLAIHVGASLLQTIFPQLLSIPTLLLDIIFLSCFAALNTRNIHAGRKIQFIFFCCKLMPIMLVILAGIYFFNPTYFAIAHLRPEGVVVSVPFVLYAFMGFEISCSISKLLKNPAVDTPKAMLIAYSIGVFLVSLFQGLLFGSLGDSLLSSLSGYLEVFPTFINLFTMTTSHKELFKIIAHLGIATSVLGAAYGIMYSNSWNLFELASNNRLRHAQFFQRLNEQNIPLWCIFAETFIVFLYLICTRGKQIPLQQISSFGSIIAYSLCVGGLLKISYKKSTRYFITSVLGLGSCLLLFATLAFNCATYGTMPIFVFMLLLTIIYWSHKDLINVPLKS